MAKKAGDFIKGLLKKYQLSVIDPAHLTEVYSEKVSKFKVISLLALVMLLTAAAVVLLLFFTPLRQTVPGYPSNKLRSAMLHNAIMVDSLHKELLRRDSYLENIRQVISGGVVEDSFRNEMQNVEALSMSPMHDDSIFDQLIGRDKYRFTYLDVDQSIAEITKLNFFTPVKGVVVNRFDATPGHFGTDIVGKENAYIAAVLPGTVFFAEWSVTTGYVVQIQHDYNLISVYKHNAEVLVKPGDHVNAGDLIAIMGDEGEYSTGPHLHLELWQNGVPLDAEQYISF